MHQPPPEITARLEEKIVTLKRELRNPYLLPYHRCERELALENAEEVLNRSREASMGSTSSERPQKLKHK